MKINTDLLSYVKSEIENLEFGSVTIIVNSQTKNIDIETKSTQRFKEQPQDKKDLNCGIYKQG